MHIDPHDAGVNRLRVAQRLANIIGPDAGRQAIWRRIDPRQRLFFTAPLGGRAKINDLVYFVETGGDLTITHRGILANVIESEKMSFFSIDIVVYTV